MNIKNTMCKISGLTTEQKVNLVAEMPDHGFTDFRSDELYIGVTKAGSWGTWEQGFHTPKIVTYAGMMVLLGNTMQFTKSDLKAGTHFVKHRCGGFRLVLGGCFVDANSFCKDSYFKDNLKHSQDGYLDIIAVYEAERPSSLSAHLNGDFLTKIWERTEQTEAQKEMEVLQAKMDELQEQMKVVKAKI
jgi:hypothetical protein